VAIRCAMSTCAISCRSSSSLEIATKRRRAPPIIKTVCGSHLRFTSYAACRSSWCEAFQSVRTFPIRRAPALSSIARQRARLLRSSFDMHYTPSNEESYWDSVIERFRRNGHPASDKVPVSLQRSHGRPVIGASGNIAPGEITRVMVTDDCIAVNDEHGAMLHMADGNINPMRPDDRHDFWSDQSVAGEITTLLMAPIFKVMLRFAGVRINALPPKVWRAPLRAPKNVLVAGTADAAHWVFAVSAHKAHA
jgi:hypothetical protein